MTTSVQQGFQLSPYWVDGLGVPSFDWKKYQDKIDIMPESLYNVLISDNAPALIESIIQNYSLSLVQGSDIARVARDVVLADVYIGDMPSEISKRLGIDQNTGREIANQIVSQIFTPAIEDIKKMQAAKFPNRVAQRQAIPTQQPTAPRPIPGADLPETGGNIIDLRNQK